MPAMVFGMLTCALVAVSQAQPLDLRGRIVQANGVPVAGAVVELKVRGTTAKTAADGTFTLDMNTAVRPDGGSAFGYRLYPGFLSVEVRAPMEVRLDVIDGAGRPRGGLVRRLEAGGHRIAWAEAIPASGRDPGLLFLRVRLGGRSFTHPFFRFGNGTSGLVFAPAYADAAAKRAAAVDTLRVRKAGYREFAKEIANYAAGDLGDLILEAAPEDGNVCARQHAERTSDGVDVVVCEELFASPPRVHVPAAPASSAYAMLTNGGFVAVGGESYPYAASAGFDSEIRRHASALYEIKLRNGTPESFRPAILFAESLFLAPLRGKEFEGLISNRTNGRYGAPTLPVRMRILAERFNGGTNSASPYELKASITNLARAVTASDGACMPALSSYGSQAPFDPGSDVAFSVGRVPSMHVFGDDELVFGFYLAGTPSGTIMSQEWFFTPLDLVKNALTPSGTYTGVGHGSPGYIPMFDLAPASGGGEACTPK